MTRTFPMSVAGVLAMLSPALSACVSSMTGSLPVQKTVDHVDLPKFMGRWYVIANIPTSPEKGAVNATETYTWNEEKQQIDIDFRFKKDRPDGAEKKIPQKAFVYNHETNAEWRVQPIWPLKFAYLIVGLADDFSDTIIGVPDRSHVWIMARKPQMAEARFQALKARVAELGYDMSKFQRVPQID